MGVVRFGAILSSMTANPPSIFFFFCAHAAVVMATATPMRNVRREVSIGFVASAFTILSSFDRFMLFHLHCR